METEIEPPAAGTYEISPRRISDIPERYRPREIMRKDGVENVSVATLLAVVLRSGVRGTSVLDLADKLLNEYGSLGALSEATVPEIKKKKIKGIGEVKLQVIQAALELARRLAREENTDKQSVRTPEDAARTLRADATGKTQEHFWVLLLDTKYRLRRPPIEVTKGILDASLVHPREVFKEAIRSSSAAVVLVHNHPSGDPSPSSEDIRITRQLVEAGKIMDIQVLDHVILGRRNGQTEKDFVSLRESGLVDFGVK
jgi:DNA repair protein RadC